MTNLDFLLPIVFYGRGAGSSEILIILEEKVRSSTAVSSAVGDDQEEDDWGQWGASGLKDEDPPPELSQLCIEAGFVRTLKVGDDFKTKPKPHRSGGALASREYRRDSEDGPWEVLHITIVSPFVMLTGFSWLSSHEPTDEKSLCGFSPLLREIVSKTPAYLQPLRDSSFLLC